MPSFMIVRLQISEIKREQTDKQTDKQTDRHTENAIYIYRFQLHTSGINLSKGARPYVLELQFRLTLKFKLAADFASAYLQRGYRS